MSSVTAVAVDGNIRVRSARDTPTSQKGPSSYPTGASTATKALQRSPATSPPKRRRIAVTLRSSTERQCSSSHAADEERRDGARSGAAVDLVQAGVADALVTAPISKSSISEHHLPDFRGHTDYLAMKSGLTEYGRDYLMAFLAPDLQVALLTTHLPLAAALAEIDTDRIIAALELLQREVGGRIAVAGINPHAEAKTCRGHWPHGS